jgi:hypothetical protein
VWSDPNSNDTAGFSYAFNVCQDVNPNTLPSFCNTTLPSPAWQFDQAANICYPLGSSVNTQLKKNVAAAVHDMDYPAAGFELSYLFGSGQFCPQNVLRSLTLVFLCADRPFPGPGGPTSTNTTFIEETNSCNYYAWSFSNLGCPTRKCRSGRVGVAITGAYWAGGKPRRRARRLRNR